MKTNKWFFLKIGALFLLLMGCQLPKEKRLMHQEMQGVIDDSFRASSLDSVQTNQFNFLHGTGHVLGSAASPDKKLKSVFEKRFDITADEVPAKIFFLSLVEDTPYNITVHPNITGAISLQLKKVTIPEILETIQNVYGFAYNQTPQGIEVLPPTLQTRAFSVNYLDINRGGQSSMQVSATSLSNSASSSTSSSSSGGSSASSQLNTSYTADFWKELKASVESMIGTDGGRKVVVSPLASLIIVQAMPDELNRVQEFLRKAELSLNKQVILEAKILEVHLNDSYQAGINWGLLSGRLNAAQVGGSSVASADNITNINGSFPIQTDTALNSMSISPGEASSALATAAKPFGGVFALATNYKNLSTFMELLSAQGDVHVLSNPRISTLNNQKALIKVGDDQYFVTNVSTTTSASGGTTTSTPTVTFSPFFSGVSLDVTPHITDADEVTLHIHPTISNVQDQTKTIDFGGAAGSGQSTKQSYPLAKSSVRESDSMVKARNGEMVVIGGLIQNQSVNLKEGVPVLGKLPLIGNLFRHTAQSVFKSELVILIRPMVVSEGVSAQAVGNTLGRIQEMNEEIDERDHQ